MPYLDDTGVEYLVGDLKAKTDAAYQPILVSGTNIKTVNGSSVLGSGDLTVSGTTWYGTSTTAVATAEKVVTCTGFELTKGAIISVMFSLANTAATPTLNVNGTGATSIRVGNTNVNGTTNVLKWSSNTLVTFIYDGTYFQYITARSSAGVASADGGGSWYGTSSTAATTAAKICNSIGVFRLTRGAVVHITFSTANTYVSGALTLNIDSTGAYDIYVNNAVTSASNTLTWDAGECLTFVYSGSYYYFCGKSKAEEYTLPTASTSTLGGVKVDGSTVTIDANGVISAAASGGVSITYATVNIAVADWSNNACTKTVSGVTANSGILVTYAPASKAVYTAADIYCSAQAANSLTFTCGTTPTAAVTVNVMIIEGGVTVVIDWANVVATDGNYYTNCAWTPTVGAIYSAHFTSSSVHQHQGNVELTCVERSGQTILTPTPSSYASDWWVQFSNNGIAEWYNGNSYSSASPTISLTIYG